MEQKDGGPAFPQTMVIGPDGKMTNGWDGWGAGGMNLRDYFAAKAMQGWIANSAEFQGAPDLKHAAFAARFAYAYADAMLKAREQK